VETLAELPLIGDQVVCLSHDRHAGQKPAIGAPPPSELTVAHTPGLQNLIRCDLNHMRLPRAKLGLY
jgi:hypothetical protein